MGLKNLDIRLVVADSNLSYRAIAEQIGIRPEYLSRCLANTLTPSMRSRIIEAVNVLTDGAGGGGDAKETQ